MISLLAKLPITTPREQDLRQACRGTLLLMVVTLIYAFSKLPAAVEHVSQLLSPLWPFVVSTMLYILLGSWLYRAHLEAWKILTDEGFMKCPKCGLSLIHAADGGTCTECKHRHQSEDLKKAWHAIYKRHLRSMRPGITALPEPFRPQVPSAA